MASQWEQIKWIPGTRLMVDGFRYQNAACKSYLLTHYHSDHTTGLTRGFNAGLVFCTTLTARLLRREMGLPSERIVELPMNEVTVIEGTEVTPICANHCPGACMLLFKTRGTVHAKSQIILHTGDMRWDDGMAEHPALKGLPIDFLFMDTTYAKPTHTHPPQASCAVFYTAIQSNISDAHCIAMMADIMKAELASHPRTVFVCGSYHIGKERAYLGAAKLLGWKVWCDAGKLREQRVFGSNPTPGSSAPHPRKTLRMLDLPPDLMACLAARPEQAKIHVDFLGGLQPEKLQKKLDGSRWTHAVGFRPTGWTFRKSGNLDKRTEGSVTIYGVPYSEHSSWTELRSCVALLRPRRLVPTVNASNPAAARTIVNRFADLMDLSGDRSRLDFFLRKQQQIAAEQCQREVTVPTAAEPLGEFLVKSESEPADSKGWPGLLHEEEGIEDSEGTDGEDLRPPEMAAVECQAGGLEPTESTDSAFSERCSSIPSGTAAAQIGCNDLPSCGEAAKGPEADIPSSREGTERSETAGSAPDIQDVDITDVDVEEQLRILQSIGDDRKRHHQEVAQCLAKKKQATLAMFFGR